MSTSGQTPLVSVIMANFNGAAHIAAAVRSVLRQTEPSLELILSDDGSTDDSLARARAAAGGDPRLIVLETARNGGPAAARNRALAAARGRWIAIVDNDDFIHPERLERLVSAAERDRADIAVDDLLVCYDDGAPAHPMLRGALAKAPSWITPAAYARANRLFAGGPALGYLKPIFRRVPPDEAPLVYDESLRIAEDFDLVMRLLLKGARMRLYPDLGYFYRKHAASISHRMRTAHVEAMLAAHDRISAAETGSVRAELDRRRASLTRALAFSQLIDALKARQAGAALAAIARAPGALALMRYPIAARLTPKAAKPAPRLGPPRIALLSRQRVVGATNGSSAYLLALAGALKSAGYAVDFIGASPKLFGRWPFFKLKPETRLFSRYVVRGAVRLGPWMIARDPRRALAAGLAVLEKALGRIGLRNLNWSRPADYSIGAAAERDDMIYVARQVAPGAVAIVCDYAFLAPMAPYALAPDAPVFTIMHDLMSARVDSASEVTPGAWRMSAETEFKLLGQADVVIAIQAEEAQRVRAALPGVETVVAPHAATCAPAPQPGRDDTLLFVGSNTAPNITGLEWFFAECWPAIRAARPNMTLQVAGSVGRALARAPEGVRLLGVVPDLEPCYREVGVVISPLRSGSGLKIKLIEALAAGKAIVGTPVTAQGVERLVIDAMVNADAPAAFAEAIIDLAGNPMRRTEFGAAALACARAHFSADACFADLVARVRADTKSTMTMRSALTTPA